MGAQRLPAAEQHFSVAIIGAGIGGLALAIGLQHHGVPFTLYEAAKSFSAIGAGVGLGPNAIQAMEDLQPGFTELYKNVSSGNVTPGKDHVMMDGMLVEEGLGEKRGLRPISYGASCYTRTSAHRKDLLDIMTRPIDEANVRFNKRVKSISQNESGAVVTFEDGEVVTASCAIGSDGIKGISRRAVLGDRWPEQVDATYTGRYVYRAIIPMEEAIEVLGKDVDGNQIAGDAKMFMGEQCIITTFPIQSGARSNMVCFRLSDEPWTHPEWTKEVPQEYMVSDIAGLEVDHRLVKLLDVSISPLSSLRAPLSESRQADILTFTLSGPSLCSGDYSTISTLRHTTIAASVC